MVTMTELHENLGWVIGGVVATIAAFLSWFFESGFLNTVIGIIIGASIAFFVQTRTQKRAWKREYAIKVVEEVYAPLFKNLKRVIEGLEERSYWAQLFETWREIRDSHKYLMIDEPFRTKIDDLDVALRKYSRAISKIRGEITKIFSEEARKILEISGDVEMQLDVRGGNTGYGLGQSDIVNYLLKGKHPKERPHKSYPELKKVEVYDFVIKGGRPFHTNEIKKFDKFWWRCVERIRKNPTIQFVLKENERLLIETKKLKQELAKRIQEPWNI